MKKINKEQPNNSILKNQEVQEKVITIAQELYQRYPSASLYFLSQKILLIAKKTKGMSEIGAIPLSALYRFICYRFIDGKIFSTKFSPYFPLDIQGDGKSLFKRSPNTDAKRRINNSQQELRVVESMMGDGFTVEFAMLFDSEKEANEFVKDLLIVFPGLKKEK